MRPCIALDTAVLLQAVLRMGRYRDILIGFAAGRFVLVVSNDILLEYEEILKQKGGPTAWEAFRALLDRMARERDAVHHVHPTYFWRLVEADHDDDKFVDAAVAGDADWIVTEDSHYNVLNRTDVVSVKPMHPAEFIARFLTSAGPPAA